MKVSFNVRQQIGSFLPPNEVPEALAAMELAELPFVTGTADRIQFAILLLAQGNLERFQRELRQAQIDWRDTLVAARLADGDWPVRLTELGIKFDQP
mgnify:CR=1 FL=1